MSLSFPTSRPPAPSRVQPHPPARSGADQPLNITALLTVMLGVSVISLDISMTSTALPEIAKNLGVAPAKTIWIVNIYYLAVVAALLPLAALGEIYGHRRVFFAGLLTVAAGALASGLAGGLGPLMAGRALLGIGSAAVSATTPALIRDIYPPEKLARGLGFYAMIAGAALSAGPPVTSAILAVADWRWLYLPTAPLALLTLILAARRLPETERNIRRFDPLSGLLCSAMFACLLFAIAGAAHLGATIAAVALAGAALTGSALLRHETGQAAPILGADLFRLPIFALSSATSIIAYSVQGMVFVLLPFLFQYRMGFTQIEAGLLIIPWPLTLIVMTLVSPRLTRWVAPGFLGGLGLALLALGLGALAGLPESADTVQIGWRLVICGVGFGLFQSPNMVAIMQSAPRARSGSAGGILAMSRLLGQSIGAALFAFCLAHWHEDGIGIALQIGTGLALAGAAISALRLLPGLHPAALPSDKGNA
ncbi:MFS transporter [Paracoccus aminophilus]|uniref:Major facilitator superfamily transporter n=1 Tax=Paracoccus aminophilus JCM 7686 TaxID=1367847 RepID=S5YV00_PARAH|nr:MFS transporter [Paracoccus aminophilus]AGT09021.1 major facilitator superfamily transporter [Paracoccus aminophilus JCM 7686]